MKTKKELIIEGMSCGHCKKRVEEALNALEDTKAKVNLKKNSASVTSALEDSVLTAAVEKAGYKVLEIR